MSSQSGTMVEVLVLGERFAEYGHNVVTATHKVTAELVAAGARVLVTSVSVLEETQLQEKRLAEELTKRSNSKGSVQVIFPNPEKIQSEPSTPTHRWVSELHGTFYNFGDANYEKVTCVVGFVPTTARAGIQIRDQWKQDSKKIDPEKVRNVEVVLLNVGLMRETEDEALYREMVRDWAAQADHIFSFGPKLHEHYCDAYSEEHQDGLKDKHTMLVLPPSTWQSDERWSPSMGLKFVTFVQEQIPSLSQKPQDKDHWTEDYATLGDCLTDLTRKQRLSNEKLPEWQACGLEFGARQFLTEAIKDGQLLKSISSLPQITSQEELMMKLRSCTAVVAPETECDEFNFFVWEAVGLGTPVQTTTDSGVGQLLTTKFNSSVVHRCVVNLHGKDQAKSRWLDALHQNLLNKTSDPSKWTEQLLRETCFHSELTQLTGRDRFLGIFGFDSEKRQFFHPKRDDVFYAQMGGQRPVMDHVLSLEDWTSRSQNFTRSLQMKSVSEEGKSMSNFFLMREGASKKKDVLGPPEALLRFIEIRENKEKEKANDSMPKAEQEAFSLRKEEKEDTSNVIGWKPDQDTFVKATVVDWEGSEITVAGVKLTIPKGALQKSVEITLTVMRNFQQTPSLQENETLLSPVVSCEPTGLTFEVPVTLCIPHCAYNVQEDWAGVSIVKSETDRTMIPEWNQMEDTGSAKLSESNMVFHITHFTLFGIIGRLFAEKPVAKLVHLVATCPAGKTDDFLEAKVHIVNDYSRVEQTQEDRCDRQPMKFYSDGGNLNVNLTKYPDGWIPKSEHSERALFDLIWHGHCPTVKFVLEPTLSSTELVYLEIKTFQQKYCDFGQTLKVTQRRERASMQTQESGGELRQQCSDGEEKLRRSYGDETEEKHTIFYDQFATDTKAQIPAQVDSEKSAQLVADFTLPPPIRCKQSQQSSGPPAACQVNGRMTPLGVQSSLASAPQSVVGQGQGNVVSASAAPPIEQALPVGASCLAGEIALAATFGAPDELRISSATDGSIIYTQHSANQGVDMQGSPQQCLDLRREESSGSTAQGPANPTSHGFPVADLGSGDGDPIPETPLGMQEPWTEALLWNVARVITNDDDIRQLGFDLLVDPNSVQQILNKPGSSFKSKAYDVLIIFHGSHTKGEQHKREMLRKALCEINKATYIHKFGI